jgi:monooxygenase
MGTAPLQREGRRGALVLPLVCARHGAARIHFMCKPARLGCPQREHLALVYHPWQRAGVAEERWASSSAMGRDVRGAEREDARTMSLEHADVLIVGAGLSGVGAACHLQRECPGKTFTLLEARGAIGGTWDLFRYPGIRSDSDMFTLGYAFKPWEAARSIADGPSILAYVRETAREYGVDRHIRFHHRVVRAEWSSQDARWTVEAERTDTHERVRLTCSFLYACTGYYRYDEGYTPPFEDREKFKGALVHPQHWPEDLDYAGKRVVVIGSGATAVTLVPAMAEKAAHVTMLQRSPTYVLSLPAQDPVADAVRKLLPRKLAYDLVRWKNRHLAQTTFKLSRKAPGLMKALIRRGVKRRLPKDFDVERHFTPTYNPWDQRLCLVTDGDLFEAIREGRASVATGRIERFTEKGLRLASGEELEADVIVTATGLNLLVLGGMTMSVDRQEIDVSRTVGYKGMMFSGVPNLAVALGYTNASWTLKCDLVSQYVCRLLQHMGSNGYRKVTPVTPDPLAPTEPFIDLKSGYVTRSLHLLPRQGARTPWRLNQDYKLDVQLMKHGALEDEGVQFSRGT